MNLNILVVGIGGQGVMTAAEVLAHAGLAAGWDVCKTEVAGMSQRGGIVSSQVRIASAVHASEIRPGETDLLMSLELAEGLRWCHWLRPGGRAVVNTQRAVPPIVASGRARYPDDPLAEMRGLGHEVLAVEATAIALRLGDVRLANTVMLGAASAGLPFGPEALLDGLLRRFQRRPELRAVNESAFEAGRAQAVDRAAEPAA